MLSIIADQVVREMESAVGSRKTQPRNEQAAEAD
jgi:hypothetical protein